MRKLRSTSTLAFKLPAIAAVAMFAAISLVAAYSSAKEFRSTLAAEKSRQESMAVAFSASASAGLAAGDRRQIYEAIRAIRELPNTSYVAVRDMTGETVAEIGSGVTLEGRDGALEEGSLAHLFFAESITVNIPMRDSGAEIGALEMRTETGWLRERILRSLLETLGVAAVLSFAAALITNLLIRRFVAPLKSMAAELAAMEQGAIHSSHFDHDRDDEVGVLADAFNLAFRRIDERDRKIRAHADELERTVEERTRDLRIAVRQAEEANAAKSDFLATMSHEIRTPMNGMMVMAEILAASPLPKKYHRHAEVITRSGRSLLTIINDILDLSKIESGRMELESIPVSVDQLVEDTASLFAARAQEKGLSLAIHVAADVPSMVIGDPTRLGQIISNLTNNAIKFTETGGVTVSVSSEGTGPDGRRILRFAITDTGIGIAQDKLSQVFEKFTQAEQGTTRTHGGTGLGLSISRQLTEAMDGTIGVDSTLGEGTVFSVTIPFAVHQDASTPANARDTRVRLLLEDGVHRAVLMAVLAERNATIVEGGSHDVTLFHAGTDPDLLDHDASPIILLRSYGDDHPVRTEVPLSGEIALPFGRRMADMLAAAMASADYAALDAGDQDDAAPRALPDFGAVRVLAVDDNAVNREVLRESLLALSNKADFAASGPEAVQLAADNNYDLIFMDCSMPGMDGYEATRLIHEQAARESRAAPRIVALTAHVTGAEARKWRDAGMDGYLAKPYTIDQLARELEIIAPTDAIEAASVMVAASGDDIASNETAGDEVPVLSPETLAMFDAIAEANGDDMRGRIFAMFAGQADSAADDIKEAIAAGSSAPDVAAHVHALKSMCNSAGAARAAAFAQVLEDAAKTGHLPDADDLGQLKALLAETTEAMQENLAATPRRKQV